MINQIRNLAILMVILFWNATFSFSQELIGLWEIQKVNVGSMEMTPVARWSEIKEDGTFYSGNGWMRHSEGIWSFDSSTNEFLPENRYGPADSFGSFKVSFDGVDKMTWTRVEEGEEVVVSLTKVQERPTAHWDLMIGLWELKEITDGVDSENKKSNFSENSFLFIRWDRIYNQMSPEEGRQTGYWHSHGHRPEMTFLSHNSNKPVESWKISFQGEDNLQMEGISDTNKGITVSFQRLSQFPD
ncbi:hypothetical protein E4S40_04025 [Algoriphagus kandeliae]|uniref:Lipocalin-like domain-containing protein n=1 Tax=Algoriphagus kandeliae TaxID=2562278 RepID=A0A4Y9R361_9BACT|nr:hypothetical protein [Algoriphagus kandeliae]TFV97815.1 hypothetical protein E4S40_04025 [Algoriphagus kandeliae]